MPWRNLLPEMQQTLAGFAWALWWALIGRGLYHANLVRQGGGASGPGRWCGS